jgi:hypothetical protein
MINFAGFPLYQRLKPEVLVAEKAKFAERATVQKEIEYFREKVATITTPEEFLKDYRLLKFTLEAYGMSSQLQYPFRIKQIMLSDPLDPKALLNKMSDPSYQELNRGFKFSEMGVERLSDPGFLTFLETKYAESKYEEDLGTMNKDLPNALYFERKIKNAINGFSVIGDPVLFDVVKTVFNIPNSAVVGSVERTREWIDREFDFTKVNDTKYIQNIVQRYLVLKDVAAIQSSGGATLLDMFA